MGYLANIITVASLACGFASLIFSLEQHFTFAAWAIILSVILDGLDGQIARRNGTGTDFGKELDSLADVICFGVAPSILGYIFVYRDFYLSATLVLFVYLAASVMRLAKYNITPKKKLAYYFLGLPTTASGGILASFILIFRGHHSSGALQAVPIMFILLVLALSFLMISRVRYLNLDGIKKIFGKNLLLVLLLLFALEIAAGWFKKVGVVTFSLFILYLFFSPSIARKLE